MHLNPIRQEVLAILADASAQGLPGLCRADIYSKCLRAGEAQEVSLALNGLKKAGLIKKVPVNGKLGSLWTWLSNPANEDAALPSRDASQEEAVPACGRRVCTGGVIPHGTPMEETTLPIQAVQAYQTTDGQIFLDRGQAEYHTFVLRLSADMTAFLAETSVNRRIQATYRTTICLWEAWKANRSAAA